MAVERMASLFEIFVSKNNKRKTITMLLKMVFCFLVLLMLPAGNCGLTASRKYCFNAQVQDAYILLVDGEYIVEELWIRTIKDTTAVKQKFHIDYFHPESKAWSSYQENRRTMLFTLPPANVEAAQIVFADPFVAKSVRVSLKNSDAVSWLGEICVEFYLMTKRQLEKATSCQKGFYGDGKFCLDINECADNTGNFCPPSQHCLDYPGSFSCPGTCLEDKLPNNKTGVCEDHCFHKGYLCHPKARCLFGKCVCDSGYEGDGSYCSDSCTAKGFSCDPNANCAEGVCKCREGYRGNGEICQGICHFNLRLCHPKAVCRMNICKCKPGYVGDGISRCTFSRKLYEKEMKRQRIAQTRLDIVETDVFEVLHVFQRLRSALNPRS